MQRSLSMQPITEGCVLSFPAPAVIYTTKCLTATLVNEQIKFNAICLFNLFVLKSVVGMCTYLVTLLIPEKKELSLLFEFIVHN